MTEYLTTKELKTRIVQDTTEIVSRDILLGGDSRLLLAELFGMTMTAVLAMAQKAPQEFRIRMLCEGVPSAFKSALSANLQNLLEGHYEEGSPSDA